jgi:FkbM family methyltransferase
MIHYSPWRNLFAYCGIDLIIDVGANTGQTYDSFRWAGFEGPIYSFEPNPEVFERLERHPGHNWRRFPYALSSQSGKATFNITSDDNASGLHVPLGTAKVDRTITVPTFRLDQLWKQENFSAQRVFLKIDAEGHDIEVIKGASGIMDKIQLSMTEAAPIPRFSGEPALHEHVSFLQDLGFCVCRAEKNSFNRSAGMDVALDLVFMKRELAVGACS